MMMNDNSVRNNNNNDNSRSMLLKKIGMYSFAMWELHIYLDTHPNDRNAQALHNEYAQKYRECVDEFERLYGPLNVKSVNNNTMAEWVSNPWPWDLEGN